MRHPRVASICLSAFVGLALACLAFAGEQPAAQAEAKPVAPAPRGWVELALERPVPADFSEKPLGEVAQVFAERAGAPILIDRKALNAVGMDEEVPVSLHGGETSLRNALARMLRQLELAWVAQDGVLLITTPEEAENALVTRVYPVADLLQGLNASPRVHEMRNTFFCGSVLGGNGVFQKLAENPQAYALVQRLESLVAPSAWDEVGGPGSAVAVHKSLVVSQTEDVHRQIASLFDLLRAAPLFDPKQPPGPLPPLRDEAAEDRRVREALRRPVTLDLKETPLGMAMRQLEASQHLVIDPDLRALNAVGIGTDAPVTLRVQQMPLASALRLMLDQLDLTYIVRDGVLLVTTPEEYENMQATVVYPVGDLLRVPPDADGWEVAHELDRLIETIQSTVQPATWSEVGGPGAITHWPARAALLICAGERVHNEVARLIGQLRAAQAAQPQAPLPPSDEQAMVTRVIKLPMLLARDKQSVPPPVFPPDQLEEVLRALLNADEWNEEGAYLKVLPDRVVVRHRPRVAREVRNLIQTLASGSVVHGNPGVEFSGVFNLED